MANITTKKPNSLHKKMMVVVIYNILQNIRPLSRDIQLVSRVNGAYACEWHLHSNGCRMEISATFLYDQGYGERGGVCTIHKIWVNGVKLVIEKEYPCWDIPTAYAEMHASKR